jgi:mono/diheme cytochrome c family protein
LSALGEVVTRACQGKSLICRILTVAAFVALAASPALPQAADPGIGPGNGDPAMSSVMARAAARGKIFVRERCARCHAVDATSASPPAGRPRPFHALRLRYLVADLQRPLAEGIHPVMPIFRLTPGQLDDVMAYLKTLEAHAPGQNGRQRLDFAVPTQ